ncbi:MAG TPA: NADH-quinone oxidoreductase subunit M [Gaiellaceae bacterium]|jgi:NADH-quinone oxidoreductase subunit M|nr:NADH-quinone oxidoreductase subunit M [Gaiellaceae bacterium]
MTHWLTTILIFLPMAGGLVVWLCPMPRAWVASLATLVSLVEIAFWIEAVEKFDFGSSSLQLAQRHSWFRELNSSYHVGQYGFSLWLVGLTAVCGAAACAYAWWVGRERPRAYFGLLLLTIGSVVGVFTAQDLLVFYAFFEAMLIPLYVLIGVWGGAGRLGATIKFVVYTVAGSLLMLASIIVYGLQQGTFDLTQVHTSSNDWLFLGFAIAFAVKAPLWPFHGWLPDAYRESPPEISGLLSGVISKVAAYGFLRIAIFNFPGPVHHFRDTILTLAAIGLVYGAFLAFRAPDIRGVVSYSSLSQMGLITFGLFATNSLGFDGAVLQMVNHGLISMTMFLLAGMVERRAATGELSALGGMARGRPALATVLMTVGVMALAVPLSSNFAGEFLILAGVFQQGWVWAAIGAGAIVLAAMYMLRLISAVLHREVGSAVSQSALDLRRGELAVLVPLIAILLFLSAWPGSISDRVFAASGTIAAPTAARNASSSSLLALRAGCRQQAGAAGFSTGGAASIFAAGSLTVRLSEPRYSAACLYGRSFSLLRSNPELRYTAA